MHVVTHATSTHLRSGIPRLHLTIQTSFICEMFRGPGVTYHIRPVPTSRNPMTGSNARPVTNLFRALPGHVSNFVRLGALWAYPVMITRIDYAHSHDGGTTPKKTLEIMATSTGYGQVVITTISQNPGAQNCETRSKCNALGVCGSPRVPPPPPHYSMSYTKETICDPVIATQFPRMFTSIMIPRHDIQTTGCPIPWFFMRALLLNVEGYCEHG